MSKHSKKALTMDYPTCGSGVRWCAQADKMLAIPGMHVLDVADDDRGRLVLAVKSGQHRSRWSCSTPTSEADRSKPRQVHAHA